MENNINKTCLEKILSHLTKLISATEFENMKDLQKLVDMAISVSAQLNATNETTENEDIQEE